ncbi:MAG: hypothetical protein ABH854_00635 [Candidatus Diapherotrites archaeon]
MKGSFLIKTEEKGVISGRGARVFIMERLLNSPMEKGDVLKVDDRTIEVRLEGTKEQIFTFKNELEKAFIAKYGK